MLNATRDVVLPTTVTGSWPRPSWFTEVLHGRASNHSTAAVEPPQVVADLIRKALEYVPPERLVLTTDCGFGREGLARRVAFYKAVAINLGANIVRRELKLPEVAIPAADPRFTFAG